MKALTRCLFPLLLTLGAATAPGAEAPRVPAGGEMLEGYWAANGSVAAFLGVPFAQPPLKQLRWKKPHPLEKPQNLRKVQAFAPACMQTMRILDWYRDLAELFGASRSVYDDLEVSEDCLYLNIWTPDINAGAGLPVMVWIHGGSNNSGWSYEPNYIGEALAQRGVVVVSIAYRVGIFGFFSPPGLKADEGLANFGLWDQLAALQWVQSNIQVFGGDPSRVTVFGESSGAQNIAALMFSPELKGRFQRAVLESTPANDGANMLTLGAEEARGLAFARALGLPPEKALEALRDMPTEDVFTAYQQQVGKHYHSPVVDGQLLEKGLWDYIDAGELPSIPVIIGTNTNESYASIDENLDAAGLEQGIKNTRLLNSRQTLAVVQGEATPRRALDRVRSADTFGCHSQAFAAAMNASGGDAWLYSFSRVREGPGGEAWGAFHGAEYAYVFNSHDTWLPTTQVDRDLTGQMMNYWTRFASTGNPNGPGSITWPPFQVPEFAAVDLGDSVKILRAPEARLCAIYQQARKAQSQ
jgi:para-nitrobenzyl esterase